MQTNSERLKERYKQQYREADQTVKRMIRADKQAYMENLASQAEKEVSGGRKRKGIQNHDVSQWQVPGNNRPANYGQARPTSYYRSRTRS